MWQQSRSNRHAERGVSLIEFLIYITLVVIILAASAQVLFSMRRSTTRMELEAEARQTARQAVEYIGRFIRGATDMNNFMGASNPFAVITWAQHGSNPVQACWNNVPGTSSLADAGTDIITVVYPVNNSVIESTVWPGWGSGAVAKWKFTEGCNDNAANRTLFMELTGSHSENGNVRSQPMIVMDSLGRSGWYQIVSYDTSDCASQTIQVRANGTISGGLVPAGGQTTLNQPVMLALGTRFVAFRVRAGWLEQKDGIFNPSVDNPDSNPAPSPWHRVLPNVEDLQVAWAFRDGTLWNTSPGKRLSSQGSYYTNDVPSQVGNGSGTVQDYDVVNVVGVRITVTATSSAEITWEKEARFSRPAAEDHAAGTAKDKRYHRRMTQFVMIRNRNLGQ